VEAPEKPFASDAVALQHYRDIYAKPLRVLTDDERRKVLAIPASKRPVLSWWRSRDGRATYAYDGISVRRMKH
jgi:hypothetical protein